MRVYFPFKHFFTLLLATSIFLSCEDEGAGPSGPTTPPSPTRDLADFRADLADHTANQIIIPAYQELLAKAQELRMNVYTFTEDPDPNTLAASRASLKDTWLVWQDASLFMFGPSESTALRNALNTYPTNADLIEENISTGEYILGSIGNRDAVGFPAIDYLLNGQGDEEATLKAYLTDSDWEARASYLQELASTIEAKALQTLEGWRASGDNYVSTFTAEAAQGTDVGSALGLLVNGIDLHFQRFSRDGKLAIPAGVRSAGVPRPKAVEAFYGGYSVELLVANLEAYKRLFKGVGQNELDKEGLLDYLGELDANALATDIETQWDASIAFAKTLNDPLDQQIEEEVDKVTDMFLELQKLVPLIKADMASLMGITLTNQDNDGD